MAIDLASLYFSAVKSKCKEENAHSSHGLMAKLHIVYEKQEKYSNIFI